MKKDKENKDGCLFDTCITYVLLPLWSLNLTKIEGIVASAQILL